MIVVMDNIPLLTQNAVDLAMSKGILMKISSQASYLVISIFFCDKFLNLSRKRAALLQRDG